LNCSHCHVLRDAREILTCLHSLANNALYSSSIRVLPTVVGTDYYTKLVDHDSFCSDH
jgi:hypothetical protein